VSCRLCIKEANSRCRMPTNEETRTLSARCPRCKVRGFKNCNNINPCDVCLRNNTTHLCQQGPKTAITRERKQSPTVVADSPDEPSTAIQRSRKRKKVVVEDPFEDNAEDQLTTVTETTIGFGYSLSDNAENERLISPMGSSNSMVIAVEETAERSSEDNAGNKPTGCTESVRDTENMQQDDVDPTGSMCFHRSSNDRFVASEEMILDDVSNHDVAGSNQSQSSDDDDDDDDDDGDNNMNGAPTSLSLLNGPQIEQAGCTGAISVPEDDEAQVQQPLQRHKIISSSSTSARPRRNCLGVSYI
jgi:hypothetical protein